MKKKELVFVLVIGLILLILFFLPREEDQIPSPGFMEPPGMVLEEKEGEKKMVMKMGRYNIVHLHKDEKECTLSPDERDLEVIMDASCVKKVWWTERTREDYAFHKHEWDDKEGRWKRFKWNRPYED